MRLLKGTVRDTMKHTFLCFLYDGLFLLRFVLLDFDMFRCANERDRVIMSKSLSELLKYILSVY